MQTFNKILLTSCIAAVLVSCSKSTDPSVSGKGSFELVQAGNSARMEASANTQTETFELGDIRASKTFNFVLANNGGQTIENIKIISNNANYEMSPTTITKLDPKTKAGLTPIISLGVIHGSAINGSALSTLLTKGENTAQITITGTTTNEKGVKEDVNMFAKFNSSAKIMDIAIIHDNKNLRLDTLVGNQLLASNLGGLGLIRSYCINTNDFKIKNTGNVSITINYGTNSNGPLSSSKTINPEDEAAFTLPTNLLFNAFYFEIDGSNTISYDKRLQLGNTKKAYFSVINYSIVNPYVSFTPVYE
ncbi:MAG: hypothetical protein EAZ53_02465 [Bacteroidetes bacterium]|nr:MAG: hypothetical protein EAZ53_02465 [Bacteroidota bacterium]